MGRLARLLGGSCSVGVGLAETAAASRADVRAKDFMVDYSAFVLSSLTDSRSCLVSRQLPPCYFAATVVVNRKQRREERSERSESMCQLEEKEKRIADPTKRVSRACVADGRQEISRNQQRRLECVGGKVKKGWLGMGKETADEGRLM